ncbi:MAG: TauD/TfdA family dioxygenase [Betaproteobacteria bacterium]|nr:TauD/TfdA family dioxygenase [Betaproteobacteria bacterium]MDH3436246.1 TauD/TfdA family dioxygenase [Betaproteobacteria bacterium]
MTLKLRRLSHALGAEVCGIDVSKEMSEAFFGDIYRAFLHFGILLFRDQDITREQHIEFSRRFGELDRHDALPRDRHPRYPELLMVTNEPKPDGSPSDTKYTGRQWHSDMSFTTAPSLGSLLRSYVVPEVGGDTLFANMYAAYDALSDGIKALIANLHGIHLSGTRKIANSESGIPRADEQRRLNPPVAQPVVRVHPETGRKALYIGEKVKRFNGMTDEESKPLIDYLVRHATRPEFVYRHQWKKNDIVAWDNRCVMHQALGDFDETQLRHLERTTVLGTPSGYVVAGG